VRVELGDVDVREEPGEQEGDRVGPRPPERVPDRRRGRTVGGDQRTEHGDDEGGGVVVGRGVPGESGVGDREGALVILLLLLEYRFARCGDDRGKEDTGEGRRR
jgi:hypothetical protein